MQIYDSMIFLSIARKSLVEGIKLAPVKENKQQAISYVLNEASDYEIISLLANQKLPSSKSNITEEKRIWKEFKTKIMSLTEDFSCKIPTNIFSALNEIGPISPYGLSSSKPVMEMILNEINLSTKVSPEDIAKSMELSKQAVAMKNVAMKAADPEQKAKLIHRAADMQRQAVKLKTPGLRQVIDAVKSSAHKAVRKVTDVAKSSAQKVQAAMPGVLAKAKVAATKGTAALGPYAPYLAGAALAALAAFAAYKIYQRFYSKAAKQCSAFSGAQKTACMKKAKATAMMARITELNKGMSACSKSKDPAKCKMQLSNKIAKLKARIQKVSEGHSYKTLLTLVSELIKEEDTEYQKFFRKKLEDYNVKSPSELSDEEKSKFFGEIEKEWKKEKK